MPTRNRLAAPLALLLLILTGGLTGGAAIAAPAPASNPEPAVAAVASGSPEMVAWIQAATPGDNHALLTRMAGSYTVETRFFAGPGAEAQVSQAMAEQTMVFGGRYLRQEFSGEMAGQPFHGTGFIGYDNVRKKFFSFWVDTMSTAPLLHDGACSDKACNTLVFRGEYVDPSTHKKKKNRTVTELTADGKLVFSLFDQDKKGKEFKSMELIYTRR